MNELTQQGINALKSGDRETARALLASAIKQNPNDANAWLWLAGALNKDEERIHCLQQVLRIDPGNAVAAKGLAQILERRTQPAVAGAAAQQAAAPQQAAPQQAAAQMVQPPAPEVAAPAAGPAAEPAPSPEPATQEPAAVPAENPAAADALPAVEAAAAEPAPSMAETAAAPAAAAPAAAAAMPAAPARGRRARVMQEGEQVIFRTRPSVVPALLGFWVFLIGAIAIGVLLRDDPVLSLSMAIGLGFILEVIVAYALVRNISARYELTDYQLTLRFRGQRVRVQVADLVSAEMRQTIFQQVLGTGDLLVDGAVRGELVHMRLRNIPECAKRLGQVRALISAP